MSEVVLVKGLCDEKFSQVRDEFETNFAEKGELGASFAATVGGEFVVDIYGGNLDAARMSPWEVDTIVNVYSSTKTMTFLVMLMLYDRGQVDLDAPVCSYWPEFSQNGKEHVLVKHLLSHTAGLPGFSGIKSTQELFDWNRCVQDLEGQSPWWEPGTKAGYHALTQGYLIGELLKRITGDTLGSYFRREFAEPLDADFHIGLDPVNFLRTGQLFPPTGNDEAFEIDPESYLARVLNIPVKGDVIHTPEWRPAEIPAANGHGNARSITKIQSILANLGQVSGRTFLSKQACCKAAEIQFEGVDQVLGLPIVYCMGYAKVTDTLPFAPSLTALFWAGREAPSYWLTLRKIFVVHM